MASGSANHGRYDHNSSTRGMDGVKKQSFMLLKGNVDLFFKIVVLALNRVRTVTESMYVSLWSEITPIITMRDRFLLIGKYRYLQIWNTTQTFFKAQAKNHRYIKCNSQHIEKTAQINQIIRRPPKNQSKYRSFVQVVLVLRELRRPFVKICAQ